MQKIVVFTGAGVSAESGIKTFRDHDGLWENHKISEVATPDAWRQNPKLVLDFYNERRKQLLSAKPNQAHKLIAQLQGKYDVHVITQNIDDLHEKAGSKKVIHLHGELMKCRSTLNPNLIYTLKSWKLNIGDKCELGSQLRPHVVWFGEAVPNMEIAYEVASKADVFIVVGSSLTVYPAAGLVNFVSNNSKKYLIDPSDINIQDVENLIIYKEKASSGMEKLASEFL
jgi:NAD-dependent deacetylase